MCRIASSRRLLLGVMGAALLAGCDAATEALGPEPDPLVQMIIDMGFRSDMIVEYQDYFLVEGDIVLDKSELSRRLARVRTHPEYPEGPPVLFQWVTDNQVAALKVDELRVLIQGGVNAVWTNATRAALGHWTTISGSSIVMVEATPADIVVSTAEVPGNPIAQASFPTSGGNPGGTITIDLSYAGWGNHSQRVYVMVHELGHTIGFRHTNWQGRENQYPNGANLIPGTPETDAASVMNGATGGTSWSGFSTDDRTAARTLYPLHLVTSVTSSPSPAKQYIPFSTTVLGSGFDPSNVRIELTGVSHPSSCPTPCVFTTFTQKTSTRLVASPMSLSIAGTYHVRVRNGPNGKPSQNSQTVTLTPMYP